MCLAQPARPKARLRHHLDLIATATAPRKHGVLVMDGAAWHMAGKLATPPNTSILPLPPHSPELNPVEQIWAQLRQSDWANRCFVNHAQIVDVCCQAWNRFASQPTPSEVFVLESGLY
jgi:hypothetical protein